MSSDYLDDSQRKMLAAYQQGLAEGAAAERNRILTLLDELRERHAQGGGGREGYSAICFAMAMIRSASPAPSVGEDTQPEHGHDWSFYACSCGEKRAR